ncbi:hypothetical protein D9M69_541240 [compost metagenome]
MVIELLTGLLVVITAFYAWVTYRMLKANERVVESMREQSESIYRPYISVTPFLEPDNPIFYLRIANLGKTAATDVKLEIDRSFFKFGERSDKSDLASLSAFNNKIDSLPPQSEIIFGLAQGFVIFAEGADPTTCPTTFAVTSKYKFGTKEIEEHHTVDLRPYLHADVPQDPIIRKLRAINDSINKLTGAIKSSS